MKILFLLMFLWCLKMDASKANIMEICEDFAKTYSAEENHSLAELKACYDQVAKKLTRRKDMSDTPQKDVVIWLDKKGALHLWAWSDHQWHGVEGLCRLEGKIVAHTTYIRSRQTEIFFVLDPASNPEAAFKVIRWALERKWIRLTLVFGRRG